MSSQANSNSNRRVNPNFPIPVVNRDIRKYFVDARRSYDDEEEWISKPVFPSSEEVAGTESSSADDCVDLIPNNVVGPWVSKDVYLKSHYDLLREDAVAPLRDAVAYVREDPTMMDSQTVAVYEKVHIVGITFTQSGLAFRVQFSTNRAGKNIVWEYSKRLTSGTVVALSPSNDCFQKECVIAVIAARPLEGVKLQPPEVDIYFTRAEDACFDPQQEWIMVESREGYYEAVKHTMTGLQKLSKEKFPLQEHICHLDPDIGAPEYVEENPVVDVQSVFDTSAEDGKVNLLEDWPEVPLNEELDASQWAALHRILTKRLAIIQGPPGTGKTFVSVIALKIMLDNMRSGDPPIIIAAQTNHALDQLLTHVSFFEPNYIRLGARSSDVEIKKRTLFVVRQKEPPPQMQGGALGPAKRSLRTLSQSIIQLLQDFNQEEAGTPLPSSLFLHYGILSQAQYDSLESGAKEWTRTGLDDKIDPIVTWLGDEVTNFEVTYTKDNFGFVEDEVDLEYEQLKELEAEQGLDDEDFESLKGQFLYLHEGLCGRDVKGYPEKTISGYLSTRDMWRIPARARGAVYNTLRKIAKTKILSIFRNLVVSYNKTCDELQIGRWERDHAILQDAKVVGMTTTGLSKYRGLVSSLKPKVIMIEEAAEVIEAPISVSCIESLQHLILVGDHKQLKGHCTLQELEGDPFYLDVSMFERLVNNGMDYTTLIRQRRMAPEIRQLVSPIYAELEDHPSVHDRPGIPGMGDVRSFFFSHSWQESNDSLASKYNEMEANMIVGLFLYLVLNGVPVSDITVLTFYNGQRKKLLKLLRDHPYLQGNYVKVVTVDSYQGEENEVVILSLVRSSEHGNIGFLSVENRICVALSRARRGCFIFGNAKALAAASHLWWEIVFMLGDDDPEKRRLGFHFPVKCSKHGNKTYIREPAQWTAINGGCRLFCEENLECGHKCSLRCHSFEHSLVSCNETCGKRLSCGHKCTQRCSDGHVCSCKCEINEEHAVSKEESLVPRTEGEQQALDRYQAYASGGVKEQDAILYAKAMGQTQDSMDLMSLDDPPAKDSNMEYGSTQDAVSDAASKVANVGDIYSNDGLDYFDGDAVQEAGASTSSKPQQPVEGDLLCLDDDDSLI